MQTPLEQRIKGSWTQLRGRLRETWGALTDDDLARSEGNLEQLVGRIQERTGETREQIQRRLDQLTS